LSNGGSLDKIDSTLLCIVSATKNIADDQPNPSASMTRIAVIMSNLTIAATAMTIEQTNVK
jgi:hypothetical protein